MADIETKTKRQKPNRDFPTLCVCLSKDRDDPHELRGRSRVKRPTRFCSKDDQPLSRLSLERFLILAYWLGIRKGTKMILILILILTHSFGAGFAYTYYP